MIHQDYIGMKQVRGGYAKYGRWHSIPAKI